jgi:hypothetical protein
MSNSRPVCEERHKENNITHEKNISVSNTWSKGSSRGRHLEEQNTLPIHVKLLPQRRQIRKTKLEFVKQTKQQFCYRRVGVERTVLEQYAAEHCV